MIQPIRMAKRTKAMNAPIKGQNTGETLYQAAGDGSGVEGDLLVGAREGPGDLHTPLLAKDEPQLAGRAQTFGTVGAKGRARLPARGHGAQQIGVKEAVFATRSCCACPSVCHTDVCSLQSVDCV